MITLRSLVLASSLGAVLLAGAGPASAQVSCGDVLTADTTLTADLTCPGDGLRIGADGVTLDCGGHAILGPGTPSNAGVLASNVSGVTITGCRIGGFLWAADGVGSGDLTVSGNVLADNFDGIRCSGCSGTAIDKNRLDHQFTQVLLTDSPGARILDNEATPHPKGGGTIFLRASPGARIAGNRAPSGGATLFLDRCDDAVIEDNELARNATVALISSARCRISRNTLVRGDAPAPNFGGSIRLDGSSDCLVRDNLVEGLFGVLLLAYPHGDPTTTSDDGADRNVIEGNLLRGSSDGLLLLGASENRIAGNTFERTELPIGIYGLVDPDTDFDVPSDRNMVVGNTIRDGLFGISTWRTSGNLFSGNDVGGCAIGMHNGPTGPFSPEPNAYSDNTVEGNRFFGLIVAGSSPRIEGNVFQGNGSDEPLPAGLEPYATLLGDLRGAVALVPVAGTDVTFDDADPGNDLLASPMIGRPGKKNAFSDSVGADIYALDTRAANAATLERDNQFKKGEAVRIRQDWFGLVRVEDSDGDPVAAAGVEVRDAAGDLAAAFLTGPSGFGPAAADPGRSQGLAPGEDGGPIAPWPVFTESIVDGRGRRQELTPHTIRANASARTGCATFAWDGVAAHASGSQSADGRYQIAVVRIGDACAPAAGRAPRRKGANDRRPE